MIIGNIKWEVPQGMVVTAGHGIYQHGQWHGLLFQQDAPVLAEHVLYSHDLAQQLGLALVLSGGHTRPEYPSVRSGEVTNSEASGMLEFLRTARRATGVPVIEEAAARCSFGNLFYSMLSFYHAYDTWPEEIHAISFPFKAKRFGLMAKALGIDHMFIFHPVGPGTMQQLPKGEDAWCKQLLDEHGNLVNPYLVGPDFDEKLLSRTPRHLRGEGIYNERVKNLYDKIYRRTYGVQQGIVGDLVDELEYIRRHPSIMLEMSKPWLRLTIPL